MSTGEIRNYEKSLNEVFASAQKSVRDSGYKVDSIDKYNGLITFKTDASWKSWAGQEMSVMMIDNGDGSVEVSMAGRYCQSGVVLQLTDWNEAGGIAKALFSRMDEYLA